MRSFSLLLPCRFEYAELSLPAWDEMYSYVWLFWWFIASIVLRSFVLFPCSFLFSQFSPYLLSSFMWPVYWYASLHWHKNVLVIKYTYILYLSTWPALSFFPLDHETTRVGFRMQGQMILDYSLQYKYMTSSVIYLFILKILKLTWPLINSALTSLTLLDNMHNLKIKLIKNINE